MTEVRLSHLTYGFVFMTIAVILGYGFISQFIGSESQISPTHYSNINNTLQKYDDIERYSSELQNKISSSQVEQQGFFGALGSLVSGLWSLIKTSFDVATGGVMFIPKTISSMCGLIPEVPCTVFTLLSTVIILIVVFTIISAVFQKDL